ncbi:MAG: thiamine pyrophosphate-dependent enzyme [Pirellulales bacterium]
MKNLTIIVLDNGLYEVTGGQATAGAAERTVGGGSCDFAGFAQAAGFHTVQRFATLADWQASAAEVLAKPGPRFVQLFVEPVCAEYHLPAPSPMSERIAKFREVLGAT